MALEGDLERRHARHSGLVRYLAEFWKTRRLWGAVSVDNSVEMLWASAVFMQPAEWPRRRPGRGSGGGRGRIGHGATASRSAGWGQATAMTQGRSRIRPMLVAGSALSGIAVDYSPVILFAPVPSSRTTPALLTRLPLSRAAVPFGQWNVCNA